MKETTKVEAQKVAEIVRAIQQERLSRPSWKEARKYRGVEQMFVWFEARKTEGLKHLSDAQLRHRLNAAVELGLLWKGSSSMRIGGVAYWDPEIREQADEVQAERERRVDEWSRRVSAVSVRLGLDDDLQQYSFDARQVVIPIEMLEGLLDDLDRLKLLAKVDA